MGTRAAENETPISPPPPPPPSPSPPWIELPRDVTANILQRLGAEEILKSAEKVCTTWNKVCRLDPSLWRVIHLRSHHRGNEREYDLMCRCAVDRSQGQLVDLRISCYEELNELLNYVADRCSNLRCLTLTDDNPISSFAFAEAVKKFPQLEELHLITKLPLNAKDVETIGISCPFLKSFTYDAHQALFGWCSQSKDCGRVALAIGKTMPNLHSLRLVADVIDNKGLEAIHDGCPLLESLDIQKCYDLDLGGDLLERCLKQIKDLRLPIKLSYDDFDTYGDSEPFDCELFNDYYY